MSAAARAAGSWAARAAVIVVALVAIWLSLRHALHGALERELPAFGLAIPPASGVSEGIIALNRAARDGGAADARSRELLQSALRRAPLLSDPFVVAGLDASSRDQPERARRLMEEARARDPRAIIPRYWLFDYYLRSGRFRLAIDEAEPLITLQPAAAPATVTVLTALLDVSEARGPLLAKLRTGPRWRRDFFRQVAATPRLRGQGPELLRLASAGASAPGLRETEAILRGLVRDGRYREAREAWVRTLPAGFAPAADQIYDGDFAGRPGAPPFNWQLAGTRGGGVALRSGPDGGGLAVDLNADRTRLIAEQLVLLPAGDYRLRFALRALDDEDGSDAALRARVRCASARKPFAQVDAQPRSTALATQTLDFTVPPDCPAATVDFSAVPGVEAGRLALLLTGVAVAPR